MLGVFNIFMIFHQDNILNTFNASLLQGNKVNDLFFINNLGIFYENIWAPSYLSSSTLETFIF